VKNPLKTYALSYSLLKTGAQKNARNSLVRMGRLELPRALHPLEPKSSASANSATSALRRRTDYRLALGHVRRLLRRGGSGCCCKGPRRQLRLLVHGCGGEVQHPGSGLAALARL
jgi:hypothetical protein